MRIAFYAPLKPPDHCVPSGDRRMARLLVAALRRGGHRVELASRLRSHDGRGNPALQKAIAERGRHTAERLIATWRKRPLAERPAAWFTYHLYYKAPDWVGPLVSQTLAVPYIVAEASHAPKRAGGPWASGHDAAAEAISSADAILTLNPADRECLLPLVRHADRIVPLRPFLDRKPYAEAAAGRTEARANLAAMHRLETDRVWLLTVAMMRKGDKLASYRLLADALARLLHLPWRLLVVGNGPARAEVEAALAPLSSRAILAGAQAPDALLPLYAAADLHVWPAINEAYGMTLLEGQAAGLPVVAGNFGGVAAIVADERTGLLAAPGDAAGFAAAVERLIRDPALRAAMSAAALRKTATEHDLPAAASVLDRTLRTAVEARSR